MAGRIVPRRVASARPETGPVPFPASGTLTSRPRPPAIDAAVTGRRTGPVVPALDRSSPTALAVAGEVRFGPVTTTSAGDGLCGKSRWIAAMVRATGVLAGNPPLGGLPSRKLSAGAASASSATAAIVPQASGRRTTRRTRAPHSRDGRAAVRRRPRYGIRPRSAQRPSQDSSAGSTVSEPATATPTTAMVPIATPLNTA